MNLLPFISPFKQICQAARETSGAINGQLDNIVQRWAIRLMCGVHIMALFVAWAVPQSPSKNALIASLVLAGFAVPATWTAAAVGQKKLRHNDWRDHIKALYFLWVPLAAFFAYWIGGITTQAWYGGRLNTAYYITSLAYAPFGFILQWKLAGRVSSNASAKLAAAVQKISRVQRVILHPIVGTFSVALSVMLLTLLITHGVIAYLPVLLHQEDGSHLNATIVLSSLNSLVILCITVLCRLRRAIPEYQEYMRAATRTKLETRIARVALIFVTSRATLNGTLIAAIIYGASFATSQWLSAMGVAPALAVYGKEGVSNTLWLLVPAITSREPSGEEGTRLALKRFVKRG
ncbi:hypothetical protein KSF_036420 [Reticulibacter mediterranei]|uniref:Uncharacterized protein n=1 Tax=Reticulibacter mediterranei TaxID=2778369 RepID=A0A8J3MZX5_9CHLR|nr:hypothetical protein [Reticulibacter mediterranei]GHO93594.1 hypothetical protein KSF_036420 [Reticulibacter mediterranei]